MPFAKYDGNWNKYLDALYGKFKTDFIDTKPCFHGTKLGLKRHPLSEGKEATFWHLISGGKDEATREIDIRRCERVAWARAVIDNAGDPSIREWKNERKGGQRICLWLEDHEYLVVLADRGSYLLPWTAYLVTRPHGKRRLRREYDEWVHEQGQKG